ncbi:MAG: hypothetical protein GXP42_15240 [Chloroflexi bacterium]|nr:hypothetical protein [Chloroflexota bacterium]
MVRPLYDSEYLYGFHDPGGEWIMLEKGIPGWVLFTEAIGFDPNDRSGRDYSSYANRNLGVMVRLNAGYKTVGTIPFERHYDDFARRCANFVRASLGARIWIIGNEPNHPIEWPGADWNFDISPPAPVSEDRFGEPITPKRYASCYRKVREAIHAVPGHENDLVLVAAVGPWNTLTKYDGNPTGDWVQYFADILKELGPDYCDGICLHAYTHGSDPNLVRSDAKMSAREFRNRHWHFRTYRDFMNAIPFSMRHLPVFITEANQGDDPWWNENNGWVRAAYGEIDDWNKNNTQKIRSLILYRWPKVGTDRWWIEGKSGVIEDFRQALEFGYRWTTTATPDTGKDLAVLWEALRSLEARYEALQKEIANARALSDRLQKRLADAKKLEADVQSAASVYERFAQLEAQVSALEQEVGEIEIPPIAGVPRPPIQDITADLPRHPEATWTERNLDSVRRIVIHHTATRASVHPEVIARFHVAQGKPGIAYHFQILGDGTIYQTERLTNTLWQVADSALNARINADSVALAFTGFFIPNRDNEPSPEQRMAAARLIAWLMQELKLEAEPESVVFGRNELGENVGSPGSTWLGGPRWKDKLLADVRSVLLSSAKPEEEIARLRAEIAQLTARVAELESQVAQIEPLKQLNAELQVEIERKQETIVRLEEYIRTKCGSAAPLPVSRPSILDIVDDLPQHPTEKYYKRTQPITTLVVHHTTGRSTLTPYDIARYHVNSRGWPGIGYHYLIAADGTIFQCQRHETHSYHVGAANGYSVAVSLIGEFMRGNLPSERQMESASHLIAWLMQELGIQGLEYVIGHKEAPQAQTACPGDQWIAGVYWKRELHARIQAWRTTKPLRYYLLFWDHGNIWAEADWRNAQNYIAHFRPTAGFSVADAMQAQHVVIVGGPAGISSQDEARLRAAGIDVHRLAGANEEETKAMLDELVANNTPWPGAPPLEEPVIAASAASLDELLEDEWYIPDWWIEQNVGPPPRPPEPADFPRARVETGLFPENR